MENKGYATIVLEPDNNENKDQKLITPDLNKIKQNSEFIPKKIQEMKSLYVYNGFSLHQKSVNFYHQGMYMKDYEDNEPWDGDLVKYFPTYHDLNLKQLRGYFTWRTKLKKNIFENAPESFGYIYIYELLNQIGTNSVEESIDKMKEFEKNFIDTKIFDEKMRENIDRWSFELAIINEFPKEYTRKLIPEKDLNIERDKAIIILKNPEKYSDEEIFNSLCFFEGKKLENSVVIKKSKEKGIHLFSKIWKVFITKKDKNEVDFFTRCFGKEEILSWYPLANAVFFFRRKVDKIDYNLDEIRNFHYENGRWTRKNYSSLKFDKIIFHGLIHESDLILRKKLNLGFYLKENKADLWAIPIINEALELDKKEEQKRKIDNIKIDFSGLEKIRVDSVETAESLLTEEEKEENYGLDNENIIEEKIPEKSNDENLDLGLSKIQIKIISYLLKDEDVSQILKEKHLMPTIVADEINETLFDFIGDNVLNCENDRLEITKDYVNDIKNLIGENDG